jgi:pilus assembly protein CpaB
MAMTLRSVLLLLLAAAAAGFTALYARGWLEAQRTAQLEESVDLMPAGQAFSATLVLVAKETLPAGAFVKAENLRWQAWPEEGVDEAYVVKGKRSPEDFAGAVVRGTIGSGQPITEDRVVHPGDRGFLAAVLEPGKRAVSVPVNATSGISGFVFPGDWVDVILTVRLRGKDEEGEGTTRFFSETLLSDIRVLAIDQTVENVEGEATVAKTATLEVTPKQAEKIALALEMGSLSLSLHSLARDRLLMGGEATDLLASGSDAESRRSYTLDTDVYYMREALFGPAAGAPRKQVNVLRGDKAEVAVF